LPAGFAQAPCASAIDLSPAVVIGLFKGVRPFIPADFVCLGLLVVLSWLVLFLPTKMK
jgi:hypothetical protein